MPHRILNIMSVHCLMADKLRHALVILTRHNKEPSHAANGAGHDEEPWQSRRPNQQSPL
jgi:hypothetical protein